MLGISNTALPAPSGIARPDENYAGGMYEKAKPIPFYAGGIATGVASGIYAGREGAIHKFAEPNLPWETYISPAPAHRQRNLSIWAETGRRLGAWQPAPGSYAAAPSGASGPTYSQQVTVQALPGMSPTEQAEIVARELRWMM